MKAGSWPLATSHARVLAWLYDHPAATCRETGRALNLTERTVLKVVGELESDGRIERHTRGRNNHYTFPQPEVAHAAKVLLLCDSGSTIRTIRQETRLLEQAMEG